MIAKLIELLRWPRAGCDGGSMAIEFALAIPVLATLVMGIADYGSLMNTAASLRGATRVGAEYVLANWNNPSISSSTLTTNAEDQVCNFLGLTPSSGSCSPVTPGVSSACKCSDGTWTTGNNCPPDSTDATPCSSVSNGDYRVLVSVSVTASQSFTPMFSWASFAFPSTVSASTTIRTQ
jgi:Flp pilus assembly protein TadG